jgi:hypothetical protein
MSGFLAIARNDTKGKLGMKLFVMLNEVKHPPTCHAERSEASMSGFLAIARNDTKGKLGMKLFVMLNEVKHP